MLSLLVKHNVNLPKHRGKVLTLTHCQCVGQQFLISWRFGNLPLPNQLLRPVLSTTQHDEFRTGLKSCETACLPLENPKFLGLRPKIPPPTVNPLCRCCRCVHPLVDISAAARTLSMIYEKKNILLGRSTVFGSKSNFGGQFRQEAKTSWTFKSGSEQHQIRRVQNRCQKWGGCMLSYQNWELKSPRSDFLELSIGFLELQCKIWVGKHTFF